VNAKEGSMTRTLSDRRGVTVLEFAVVAPFFLALLLGVMYVSYLFFSFSALQYAVQEAARCASVNATCSNSNAIRTYASSRYVGFGTPTFTHSQGPCGNIVNASVTYSWNVGLFSSNTPLSASACFPSS
jgi:Flp pilus assembly protein TadG